MTKILGHQEITFKVQRLAWQVYEHLLNEEELVIVGVEGNGYLLASYLADTIAAISPLSTVLASIHVDKEEPFNHPVISSISPEQYANKSILLVDDVLNSGKTLISALKHFLEVPVRRINTLVLVERNHFRYPIRADFIGLRLSTSLKDHVVCSFDPDHHSVSLQ